MQCEEIVENILQEIPEIRKRVYFESSTLFLNVTRDIQFSTYVQQNELFFSGKKWAIL